MLSARKLSKRFGARAVFRDVDFDLETGRIAAVVGANGAGKSTLLKIVAGLARPSRGDVAWHDGSLDELDEANASRSSDMASESVESVGSCTSADAAVQITGLKWRCGLAAPDAPLPRELTVGENVEFVARVRGLPHDARSVASHLEKFGLNTRRDDLAGDLSSGLRARLQLAVALLHAPPVLLLDEPSANLDEAGRALLRRLLDEQRRRGVTLVATNDEREAALCDERIAL